MNKGYYNYHGIIKRKIKNKELIKYEFLYKYNKIENVLLLTFSDGTKYPIREYRHLEYMILINKYYSNS